MDACASRNTFASLGPASGARSRSAHDAFESATVGGKQLVASDWEKDVVPYLATKPAVWSVPTPDQNRQTRIDGIRGEGVKESQIARVRA
jgi:hypothetical protein